MRPVFCAIILTLVSCYGSAQEPLPREAHPLQVAADEFLAAFQAQDEAAMKALALKKEPSLDAFTLARVLVEQAQNPSKETPRPIEASLDAARKLAELAGKSPANRSLPALVRAWIHYDAKDLEREKALLAAWRKLTNAKAAGDRDKALVVIDETESLLKDAPKESRYAIGFMTNASSILYWHSQPERAERFLADALRRAEKIELPVAVAHTLEYGSVLAGRLPGEKSLSDLKRAAEVWDRIGYRDQAARVLCTLAGMHGHLGHRDSALKVLERLDAYVEAMPDQKSPERKAGYLLMIAVARSDAGFPDKAIPMLVRLLETYESLDSEPAKKGRISTLGRLAMAYSSLGQFEKAIEYFRRSQAMMNEMGDQGGVALCYYSIGRRLFKLFRTDESLAAYEKALAACPASDGLLRAVILKEMGGIYWSWGQDEKAKDCLTRALTEFGKTGTKGDIASTLQQLSHLLLEEGRRELALDGFDRARRLYLEIGNRAEADHILMWTLFVRVQMASPERRPKMVDRVLERWKAGGFVHRCHDTVCTLGRMCFVAEKYENAFQYFSEAVELLGDARSPYKAVGYRQLVAQSLNLLEDPARAVAVGREAAEKQLRLEHRLGEESAYGVREFTRGVSDTGLAAALALEACEPDTARRQGFWFVEAGRGLVLAGGLINRDTLLLKWLPPEQLDPLRRARAQLDQLTRKAVEAGESHAGDGGASRGGQNIKAALDSAYKKYAQCLDRLQRESRRVADVVYPKPIELRTYQKSLGDSEVLVCYQAVGDRGVALVVDRTGIDLVEVCSGTDAVNGLIGDYFSFLEDPDSAEEPLAAEKLYDTFLRPIENKLMKKKRLLISPDGGLTFLPFEALIRREGKRTERVLERWDVAYVPSATVHAALKQDVAGQGRGWGFLGLGDPVYPGEGSGVERATIPKGLEQRGLGNLKRLPRSGEEVNAIAGLYPGKDRVVLLRDRATVQGWNEALDRHPGRLAAVHLACHGFVDTRHPKLTGLVLADGEILTLDHLYQRSIPADLAVLSACDTGRGSFRRGEGVIGLVRGFFYAGCPRVVVSNWKVRDDSTQRLMVSFYRNMVQKGLPTGAALRSAKLDMLKSSDHAHPFHWAAFVLWGLGD
jgi:CHAT domain-containing protein/tetratricopeptide (TPR) repeat protein